MANRPDEPRYGGRALRNGVMMVGPHAVAVAVRKPDGKIATAVEPFAMPASWAKNIPFVRGLVSVVGMLKLARISSKLEGRLNGGSTIRRTWPQLIPGVAAALADRVTREIAGRVDERMARSVESVAGVTLPFVAFGISGQFPAVHQLWRYHGAEHKAVNAAESGMQLSVENARGMSRVHPRCGTVFAFWGLVGGVVTRAVVEGMPNGRRKRIISSLAGPMILATAYEAVRLSFQVRDLPLVSLIFQPAWQSQRLTTSEPDDRELEVAVASLQAVIDYEEALSPES